ncbi:metal homeostatis protein BSD2 [Lasiosphaeria miniovina]|uniref:Metal homeostatis protein BSD2 n=1 Tax=Lasiosphaeria miniovina TaxID=1954250 RepID=A0AA40AE06_9PEZI|nr:metal homeostatis protein BSD2 [Lasiosphaeria miniovina]KAK0714164.1 metal homeostatis protein BSD2 [Lasiosphaeria miniovina]
MSGHYERVNAQDEDEPETPTAPLPRAPYPIPNSPPPSFHSRASSILSREREHRVDPDLADAFDADGDESDDEADDTQRLVPNNSLPADSEPSATTPRPPHPAGGQMSQSQTAATAASAPTSLRVYGSGIQSDGVFSNLAARPERGNEVEKEEQPPTYEQAAADAAPPYWETTILAPGLGGPDDVYIDGMPVGSFFSFVWNGLISMSFQPFIGFLLTYLLHSTHAAKNGSRAGLGITLIQYGFQMKGSPSSGSGAGGMNPDNAGDNYTGPPDPNAHEFDPSTVDGDGSSGFAGIEGSDWAAYILMIVGWFILIRAVSDYLKTRRHEQLVLQSPDRGLGIPIIAEGERSETVV